MLALTDFGNTASLPPMPDSNSTEAAKRDALPVSQLGWLRLSAFGLPGWEFSSAGAEHLRFFFWLVDVLRPSLIVDLVSGKPDEYLAVCQAIERLGYGGKCLGLSAIFDGGNVNSDESDLKQYHDSHFGQFSSLKPDARQLLDAIAPGSIALLLVGGRPSWLISDTAIQAWIQKLSPDGVVVAIDQPDQLDNQWSKVFGRGTAYIVNGRSPLQVIAANPTDHDRLFQFFDGSGAAATEVVQTVFMRLGAALRDDASLRDVTAFATQLEVSLVNQSAAVDLLREERDSFEADTEKNKSERDASLARIVVLEQYVEQFRAEVIRLQEHAAKAQYEIARLTTVIGDRDQYITSLSAVHATDVAKLNQLSNRRDQELATALLTHTKLQQEKSDLIQQHAMQRNRLTAEITELGSLVEQLRVDSVLRQHYSQQIVRLENELNAIQQSTSWRLMAPLRSTLMHSPQTARTIRRALKLTWWTVSFQLGSRLAQRKNHRRELRRLHDSLDVDTRPKPWATTFPDAVSESTIAVDAISSAAPVAPAETRSFHPLSIVPDHSVQLQSIEDRLQELTSIVDLERQRTDYALLAADGLIDEIQLYNRARHSPEYKSAFEQHMPLVSICVATMDRSDLLIDRCLRSLIGQTYRNIQIVVVGDHCTDDTGSRVAQLRDDRIVFRNLPTRGPYPPPGIDRWRVAGTNAINAALEACEGQFITHLDDDDSATADRIETLVNAAQEHSADFCWHPFLHERQDGTWFTLGDGRFELGQMTTGSIFYHRYFKRIPWNVDAYRTKEPGDWNRLRKIRLLRPKTHFVDRSLLFHYSEGSQPPFVRRSGETFLD